MDRFTFSDEIEFDKTAFSAGEAARKKGIGLQDCPYERNTFLYKSWQAGWADADMQLQSMWMVHYLPDGTAYYNALI